MKFRYSILSDKMMDPEGDNRYNYHTGCDLCRVVQIPGHMEGQRHSPARHPDSS